MRETGIPDGAAPRKRIRTEDVDDVENTEKPSAPEALQEPEPKRRNGGDPDLDLMALLDRIDSMDNSNYAFPEQPHDQGLGGVMKSLAEEVGLKPQQGPFPEDLQAKDRSGDTVAAEFNFFLDSAEDDRYAMNHFACIDQYSQGWAPEDVDYAEVAEFFHGSLWEDDIWQPQDPGEVPQPL